MKLKEINWLKCQKKIQEYHERKNAELEAMQEDQVWTKAKLEAIKIDIKPMRQIWSHDAEVYWATISEIIAYVYYTFRMFLILYCNDSR